LINIIGGRTLEIIKVALQIELNTLGYRMFITWH
jgi:hypothetical protein